MDIGLAWIEQVRSKRTFSEACRDGGLGTHGTRYHVNVTRAMSRSIVSRFDTVG